ncbi:hypothetical protein WISP_150531 [Willisornis vidua]|uniref:Uncharacterized protein n=1 Tax=Willisornis vidua TaxID=1566151 RepID=A0ABQ9CNQ9_9PASS|nr:hypothetical protein WISP_150531 [Willisornis vidua]
MNLSAGVGSGTVITEEYASECCHFVLSAISDAAKGSNRLDGKEEWEEKIPDLRLRDEWSRKSVLNLFGFAEHDHIQL